MSRAARDDAGNPAGFGDQGLRDDAVRDIVLLTMQRLRTPLIVLLLVYFVSACVMVLVPGQDPQGNPVTLTFLDAAYFVAILSTTIGLGEVPFAFTELQRLVVFFIIFPNVVAWLYAFTAILGLFLDGQFQQVLERSRFARRVSWIGRPFHVLDLLHRGRDGHSHRKGESFYLLCGFGATGEQLTRGLLRRGLRVVAIDTNIGLINKHNLDPDFSAVPMLPGDARERRNLDLAGLRMDTCRGVIATTNDDKANLHIAITARLLRDQLPVYARCQQPRHAQNMASFIDEDYVVNPYAIFASRLGLAMESPVKYLVQDWLLSVPGTKLRGKLDLPEGKWVVCGLGAFGQGVFEALEAGGQVCTVIDRKPERLANHERAVEGRGTDRASLERAGIEDAVGIVAGTGDDVDNLSIVITARELNHDIFVIARQENPDNDQLFNRLLGVDVAANPESGQGRNAAQDHHLLARPSLIVARRILALATTPLLKTFLEHLVKAEEDFANRVRRKLERCLDGYAPSVWALTLTEDLAYGLCTAQAEGVTLRLDHILHNTRSGEDEQLRCTCLVHARGSRRMFLPDPDTELEEGDELLFAGRGSARLEMTRALLDPVLLLDYATPERIPRTAIGRWLARR